MKGVSLLIAGGFFPVLMFSQTWSKRFEFPIEGSANSAKSLLSRPEGFLVFQQGNPGAFDSTGQHIGLLAVDQDGDFEYATDTGAVGVDFLQGWRSGMTAQNNNYVMAATRSVNNGTNDANALLLTWSEVESLWSFIEFETEYYHQAMQIIIASNGDYVITGFTDNTENGSLGLIVTRLTSEGELVWETVVPGESGNNAQDIYASNISEGENGEFVVTGSKQFTSQLSDCVFNNFKSNRVAYKISSEGNFVWEKEWDDCYTYGPPNVVATSDGNFVLCYGAVIPELSNPDFQNWRLNLIKIDTDGNEIWNKLIGAPLPQTFLRSVKELEDGSLIACGNYFIPGYNTSGVILKTTAEGDSIWMTTHQWELSTESVLNDIIPTENGFVACGYIEDDEIGQAADTWVIRTDEDGCIIPGCHVGVNENEANALIRVFPNPVSDIAFIEVNSRNRGTANIEIIDLTGKKVYQHQTGYLNSAIPHTIYLDLGDLDSGLYIVHLIIDGETAASEQIIIQK